jgi:hypothetical protein
LFFPLFFPPGVTSVGGTEQTLSINIQRGFMRDVVSAAWEAVLRNEYLPDIGRRF